MNSDQLVALMRQSRYHKFFYHFTDTRNLPSIKANGLLSMRKMQEIGIGVPAPGGNSWSFEADRMFGMDAYVHLCLMDNHPMEFLARQQGRIQETVFLQIKPEIIQQPNVMITTNVSNQRGVVPQAVHAADFSNAFDLEVIHTRTDWSQPEIKARRNAARRCEILVPDVVPLGFIVNI